MKPKTFNILKWALFPLLFFWCFLQNFLGFLVFCFLRCKGEAKRKKTEDDLVYFSSSSFGCSLGYFIFLDTDDKIDIHHEWGHQLQSLLLGNLYLLLIGLPSAISCLRKLDNFKYYNLPLEAWADALGQVKHSNLSYVREIKNLTK